MPLGPEPLTLSQSQGSYQERFQYAFDSVSKDMPALIILNYISIKPTHKEIKEAKKTTDLKELALKTDVSSQNCLVGIEAVKACKRSHGPPFLWFSSNRSYISDTKEDIKEWMKGRKKEFIGRDLITDTGCMAGYEADFVIYIGSGNVSAFVSRCRGHFFQII